MEIELADEEGNPVALETYQIELPDGSLISGTLDEDGQARVEGIDPGNCKITFPKLHKDTWNRKKL